MLFYIVDCVWGGWEAWTTCTKTCNGGVQVRAKIVSNYEENGGAACSGSSIEQKSCNTLSCIAGNVLHFCFINSDD